MVQTALIPFDKLVLSPALSKVEGEAEGLRTSHNSFKSLARLIACVRLCTFSLL